MIWSVNPDLLVINHSILKAFRRVKSNPFYLVTAFRLGRQSGDACLECSLRLRRLRLCVVPRRPERPLKFHHPRLQQRRQSLHRLQTKRAGKKENKGQRQKRTGSSKLASSNVVKAVWKLSLHLYCSLSIYLSISHTPFFLFPFSFLPPPPPRAPSWRPCWPQARSASPQQGR